MSEATSGPDVPAGERTGYDAVLDRDGVQVSKSPWGPDDEIGRLNWITAESQTAILDLVGLAAEKVYEFALMAPPLKLRGATGSPIRPIAIPLRQ